MDFFSDPRVVEAEARHSRRRRRAAVAFSLVERIFHMALLALVVLAVLEFARVIFREAFGM